MVVGVNKTATLPREKFAMHLDDTTVHAYSGITFTLDTDIDALSTFNASSISTVSDENLSSGGACSFSLPSNLLGNLEMAGPLEEEQMVSRFAYTVFTDDTFFQPRENSETALQFKGFEVGSVIISTNVDGNDGIGNLSRPARMRFQIRKVLV